MWAVMAKIWFEFGEKWCEIRCVGQAFCNEWAGRGQIGDGMATYIAVTADSSLWLSIRVPCLSFVLRANM
jgi:hypothetical protein